MDNKGCVMVNGYCIHCRRPDHLQVADDYKCPGSTTIPVAESAIERWTKEPAVQDVLNIIDCGPWESGRWDVICEKCKRASGGLAAILDERDQMREGFKKAIEILEGTLCPYCHRPLTSRPQLGDYDFPECSHLDTANQIAKLKKFLSSK